MMDSTNSLFIGKFYFLINCRLYKKDYYFCSTDCAQNFQNIHQKYWKYCNHSKCMTTSLCCVLYKTCKFWPYKIEPVFIPKFDILIDKECDHCTRQPHIGYYTSEELDEILDQ